MDIPVALSEDISETSVNEANLSAEEIAEIVRPVIELPMSPRAAAVNQLNSELLKDIAGSAATVLDFSKKFWRAPSELVPKEYKDLSHLDLPKRISKDIKPEKFELDDQGDLKRVKGQAGVKALKALNSLRRRNPERASQVEAALKGPKMAEAAVAKIYSNEELKQILSDREYVKSKLNGNGENFNPNITLPDVRIDDLVNVVVHKDNRFAVASGKVIGFGDSKTELPAIRILQNNGEEAISFWTNVIEFIGKATEA